MTPRWLDLETSVASVNSALQRARKAIDPAAPTQQEVLRSLVDGPLRSRPST